MQIFIDLTEAASVLCLIINNTLKKIKNWTSYMPRRKNVQGLSDEENETLYDCFKSETHFCAQNIDLPQTVKYFDHTYIAFSVSDEVSNVLQRVFCHVQPKLKTCD